MTAVILVVVAVVLVAGTAAVFMNKRAAGRVWAWLGGQATAASERLVKSDPVKVMQWENDKAATDIEAAWAAMAAKQALVNQLERSVQDREAEANRLTALAQAKVKAGDDAAARQYLTDKVRAERVLAEDRAALAGHKADYAGYQKTIEACQRKLKANKDEVKRLGVELKVSAAEARILQSLPDLAGAGGRMDEAREAARAKVDEQRAAAQVARDRRREQFDLEAVAATADDAEADKLLAAMKGGS